MLLTVAYLIEVQCIRRASRYLVIKQRWLSSCQGCGSLIKFWANRIKKTFCPWTELQKRIMKSTWGAFHYLYFLYGQTSTRIGPKLSTGNCIHQQMSELSLLSGRCTTTHSWTAVWGIAKHLTNKQRYLHLIKRFFKQNWLPHPLRIK